MRVPPRICHVFTKVDVLDEKHPILTLNKKILDALVRDGYVDQRRFVSCMPCLETKMVKGKEGKLEE